MEMATVIASYLEAIVVAISVLLIWKQLRDNSSYLKSSNVQSLVNLTTPFNIELFRDKEIARLWFQGSSNYDNLDEIDKWRFEAIIIHWLNIHENAYIQWVNGLLDEINYKPWDKDLSKFISETCPKTIWTQNREIYHPQFMQKIDNLFNHLSDLNKEIAGSED